MWDSGIKSYGGYSGMWKIIQYCKEDVWWLSDRDHAMQAKPSQAKPVYYTDHQYL